MCAHLTVKCFYEANELNEALKVIESLDGFCIGENVISPKGKTTISLFDEIPKSVSSVSLIKNQQKLILNFSNLLLHFYC